MNVQLKGDLEENKNRTKFNVTWEYSESSYFICYTFNFRKPSATNVQYSRLYYCWKLCRK